LGVKKRVGKEGSTDARGEREREKVLARAKGVFGIEKTSSQLNPRGEGDGPLKKNLGKGTSSKGELVTYV